MKVFFVVIAEHINTCRMLDKFLRRLLTHVSISLLFFLVKSGLQNDHKALMREIEQGIHEIHAKAREQKEKEKEDQDEESMDGLYISPKIHVTFTTFVKYVNWVCIIIKNNITARPLSLSSSSSSLSPPPRGTTIIIKSKDL